ncbi:DUF4847 family protein [Bacteroides sp. 51]|uniref:DUF4847 family protein n=1 Tax=Bacteroides sp. 51 TaxID=2302938 RepID=UPI0013D3BA15|nr:DUF4847 family protein [Bacteroides sp. 51]NDV84566.1 DUF4847 domain-containing protein [Bacteroides sp. 51]
MRLKYALLLLLLLPALSACDQTDDVLDIFTGKTWKLTNIYTSKGKVCIDDYFTGVSPEVKKESMRLWAMKDNFTISFTGAEVDDGVTGEYAGRGAHTTISGKWNANGSNNAFSTNQGDPAGNEDLLGQVFIRAIKTAYKYEGDTAGNLTIYFKEGSTDKYLLLYSPK